jgi:hypothetical protein
MPSLTNPLLAFGIVLLASMGLLYVMGRLRYRPAPGNESNPKPYACGEEGQPFVRPDYSQVFPFAFFFTILHVVALVVTTAPDGSTSTVIMALLYIVAAALGLFVLFRR